MCDPDRFTAALWPLRPALYSAESSVWSSGLSDKPDVSFVALLAGFGGNGGVIIGLLSETLT